jgi:phenylacetate-CoA ligase
MFLAAEDGKKANWIQNYFKFDIRKLEKDLLNRDENYWQTLGEKNALKTFHEAAERVPAYKDFLNKQKVDHLKIKTLSDFAKVPITDKENYIHKYSLEKRAWDGNLAKNNIAAASSGTTGKPHYWLRHAYQEYEAAITHELLFKTHFEIEKYKTLLIIGFPMGVYVSGMATALPSWLVAQKYGMTVVTAGNNKAEVLKAVENLHGSYEQIILIGHPFFIKDVIESGKEEGVKWSSIKLKLMFCSEGFSESWREYLLKETGQKNETAFNTYGSSEMLLMAYETPLSIRAKAQMEKNPEIGQALLNRKLTPNFFQYNPALRYTEEKNGNFIFTASSGLPLIRFNLKDGGKIISFKKVAEITKASGALLKNAWQLPFLALYGRSDQTIIFYAANIYPEHIHSALHHKDLFKKLTGKFTLRKDYLKNMDEYLEINIELKPKIKNTRTLGKIIQGYVVENLKRVNAEYLFLTHHLEKNLKPEIKLWANGHEKYFKPGLKPLYVTQK